MFSLKGPVHCILYGPRYDEYQSFFPGWNIPCNNSWHLFHQDVDVDVSKHEEYVEVHYLTKNSELPALHGFHYVSLGFLQFYYNVQTMTLTTPVNVEYIVENE